MFIFLKYILKNIQKNIYLCKYILNYILANICFVFVYFEKYIYKIYIFAV